MLAVRKVAAPAGHTVLGIDPGLTVMGYGLVTVVGAHLQASYWGAVTVRRASDLPQRLKALYDVLSDVIAEHKPDEMAVETPFVAANIRSAFTVGHAQAVAMLAAANHGLPVFQYAPAEVKRTVAGYGRSSKAQIQEMVRLQLEMAATPQPTDAADALAVALCHYLRRHARRLFEVTTQPKTRRTPPRGKLPAPHTE